MGEHSKPSYERLTTVEARRIAEDGPGPGQQRAARRQRHRAVQPRPGPRGSPPQRRHRSQVLPRHAISAAAWRRPRRRSEASAVAPARLVPWRRRRPHPRQQHPASAAATTKAQRALVVATISVRHAATAAHKTGLRTRQSRRDGSVQSGAKSGGQAQSRNGRQRPGDTQPRQAPAASQAQPAKADRQPKPGANAQARPERKQGQQPKADRPQRNTGSERQAAAPVVDTVKEDELLMAPTIESTATAPEGEANSPEGENGQSRRRRGRRGGRRRRRHDDAAAATSSVDTAQAQALDDEDRDDATDAKSGSQRNARPAAVVTSQEADKNGANDDVSADMPVKRIEPTAPAPKADEQTVAVANAPKPSIATAEHATGSGDGCRRRAIGSVQAPDPAADSGFENHRCICDIPAAGDNTARTKERAGSGRHVRLNRVAERRRERSGCKTPAGACRGARRGAGTCAVDGDTTGSSLEHHCRSGF